MRMRSNWFKSEKPRSLKESAGALGFISWQIASERVRNMEANKFYIDLPDRTLKVIAEYLIFISHMMDRLSYEQITNEERGELISALALKQADIFADNCVDAKERVLSSDGYIELLNQRYGEYAEFEMLPDREPSYSFYRHLAQSICSAMGKEYERNVTEQVIEIEGPECIVLIKRAMKNLLPETDS